MKFLSLLLFVGAYGLTFFFRRYERFVASDLRKELNFSVEQIGLISSAVSLGYLISRFMGGILSDMFNPCFIFFASTAFSCVPVVVSTSVSNFYSMLACFFLIGASVGLAFPSIIKMVRSDVEASSFGSCYAAFSGSHGVVGILAPLLFPFYGPGSWKASMMTIVSVMVAFLCACLADLMFFDTDFKDSSFVKLVRKKAPARKESTQWNVSSKLNAMQVVLVIGLLGFANRVSRFSADWFSINDPSTYTPFVVSLQQAGCMIGCFTSGMLSDVIAKFLHQSELTSRPYFANPRISFLLSMVLLNGTLHCLMGLGARYVAMNNLLFGLVIDAIYTMGGIVMMELVAPHEEGLVSSLVSVPNQLGGFVAGYPVAAIAQSVGWSATQLGIGLFIFITCLPLLTLKTPKTNAMSQTKDKPE